MKIDVWKMGFLVMMIGMMSCVDPYDPNIDEGVSVLANAHCIVCRTVRLAMSYRPPIKP